MIAALDRSNEARAHPHPASAKSKCGGQTASVGYATCRHHGYAARFVNNGRK